MNTLYKLKLNIHIKMDKTWINNILEGKSNNKKVVILFDELGGNTGKTTIINRLRSEFPNIKVVLITNIHNPEKLTIIREMKPHQAKDMLIFNELVNSDTYFITEMCQDTMKVLLRTLKQETLDKIMFMRSMKRYK